MTNRFNKLLRSLPVLVGGGLLFFLPIGLHAQVDKFNFNYSGPTTASANASCTRTLSSIITPVPTVTSTVGATITMSMQDPTQTTGGYAFNAPITAPATLSVGWLVKDNAGHSAHFYINITIIDNTPPTFSLINHPATLTFASVVQVPAAMPPPVSDNCTSGIIPVLVETTRPDTCVAGSFTRTWRATDLAGNTTTFTQTITISADNTPPTFTSLPQSGSSPCAQLATAYPAWLAAQMTNFVVSDPSGIKSITNSGPATFPSGCAMPLTVTFRATDNCGLVLTRTATYTTIDTDPPVVATGAQDTVGYCAPVNGHLVALNNWINHHGYQQSSDACSAPSGLSYYMRIANVPQDSAQVVAAFLASLNGGNCTTLTVGSKTYTRVRGKVTVDFLVRDICGNESYAGVATFAAVDTLPPMIVGVDKDVSCGSANNQTLLNTWINAHGNATATDVCSAATWTNFSFITSTGQTGNGVFNTGPYPTVVANDCGWYADVIFRAADQCGNIGADTLRFRTNDTTPPVISGVTAVTTLYCPLTAPANPTATVTDNCDLAPTLTRSGPTTTLLSCSGNYNAQFVWTATDACGNTSTALQTFQLRDTTGPEFTLVPAPKTFRCDTFTLPPPAVAGVDVIADDECSVVLQNITTQTVSNQDPDPAVCGHYSYQITRIFTATDDCGNKSTATQLLTIVDNVGPMPGGMLDTTVVCDINPTVSVPTAADVCSGVAVPPVFVGRDTVAGSCANNYVIRLQWRTQDVCGNTTLFYQNIHVRDTVPPTLTGVPADISVECDSIPAPPSTSIFTTSDNCSQTVTITLTETETRDTSTTSCERWTNYTLHRTWTATDACGNTTAQTQNIQIEDHSAPILVLPDTLHLSNDPGDCGVALTIPAPISVYDVCSSLTGNIMLLDTAALVKTSAGPVATTPVDTMIFQWVAPNLPPNNPVISNAVLTVYLDNADSEVASERFRILDENNQSLGFTTLTPTQCGSSSTIININAGKLNTWLADGSVKFRLAPMGTGGNAPNAICSGGRARLKLTYEWAAQQVPVTITYKLDTNQTLNYPPAGPHFVSIGNHTILYTATDCAGNSSTGLLVVTVKDTEPPVVYAPSPITAYVGQNNCEATVTLPFPTITDNCNVSGHLVRSSPVMNIVFRPDANAGLVPRTPRMLITDLIPNAVGIVKLTIRHKGDNAQNGEFFQVYADSMPAVNLHETTLGDSDKECIEFNESTFDIAAASLNTWAGADGSTFFKAVANINVVAYNDFINPCVLPLQTNMTDGVSQIQAVLEYDYARVDYEILKGTVIIQSDTLRGSFSTATLAPGVYTVKYRVTDNSGLVGTTSFMLTVRDTVKPKAFCLSKTIYTNPSGINPYVLSPAEINNNSTDNCSINGLSFALSQTIFNCDQIPNNSQVTLTVTDASGNSATCTAIVKVETVILHPYYTPVCEGGELSLFADSTLNFGSNIYNIMWTGPNVFLSSLQNPDKIPNASAANEGTYIIKIIGLTNCVSTGSVIVDLLNLPTQPILNISAAPYCEGSNITLSTPSYAGQNVNYLWYEGDENNATLLATTLASSYMVTLTAGSPQHKYFVKVAGNGCTSSNSAITMINVFAKPLASVEQPNIVVCEGQPINLGTSVTGNNLQYSWTGPPNINATTQYVQIAPSTLANAGQFKLIITNNGCQSDPKFVTVSVKNKPDKPIVSPNWKVCEGTTVTLVSGSPTSMITNGYIWTSPQGSTTTTSVNNLTLPNLTVANSGSWFLTIEEQGCRSDPSAPVSVQVQAYPAVAAPATVKLCQAAIPDTLRITPTVNTTDSILWTWTGPGGYVDFKKELKRYPGVAGTYRVVGRTTFGCADTAFVNVILSARPVIDAVTNNAPTCASCTTDALLQATVSSQYGPVTYNWTWNNGIYSSMQNPAIIPNVCSQNNGTYTLVIRDTVGCTSNPKSTIVKVQAIPTIPTITLSNSSPCAGDSVMFQVPTIYSGNYIRYIWKRPNGSTDTTTIPSLTITNVSTQNNGNYTVCVRVDSCVSQFSGIVTLMVKPIPDKPIATSPNPVLCVGETLELFASPSNGQSYNWIRIPDGFSSASSHPIQPDVTLAYSGQYFVRVTINGCTSAYSDSLVIKVNPRPATPLLFVNLTDASICREDPNAKLKLNVLPGAMGLKYQFFNADTALGLPSTATTFQTFDLSGLHPGANSFHVVAIMDGCVSESSDIKTVQLDTTPNIIAYAGEDFKSCGTSPFLLNAGDAGQGTWTPVSGPATIISNPNKDTTTVRGAVANNIYTYRWSLSNGACKNYSSDTVQVTTIVMEMAKADTFMQTCDTMIQLHAIQGVDTVGVWTQDPSQSNPTIGNIVIDDPNDPNTFVRNLRPGFNYYFYWTLGDRGCGASRIKVTVRSLSNKPDIGPNRRVCTTDRCVSITPNSALPTSETGRWWSNQPLTFTPSESTQFNTTTLVCNLQTGPNEIYWTLNGGYCQDATDTIIIDFRQFPVANPDAVTVTAGDLDTINVLQNDLLPENFNIQIITPPAFGNFDSIGFGIYTYRPSSTYTGMDQFIYKICNTACVEDACSVTTVNFTVQEPAECVLPTLITPNGDGTNDALVFTCINKNIEGIGKGELTVFNQWGNEVFHADDYNNTWEGTYNGEDLPPGTYYYILDATYLPKPVTRFLIIQR